VTGTLSLSVRLDQSVGFSTSGVAVRIESANDRPALKENAWTVLVPTSASGLSVDAAAGTYHLQAWLPSGQILRRSATLEDGQVAHIEFFERTRSVDDGRTRASWDHKIDLHKEFHPLELQPAFSSGTEYFGGEIAASLDFLQERASTLSWSRLPMAEHVSEQLSLDFLPEEMEADFESSGETTTVSIKPTGFADPDHLTQYRHWIRVHNAHGVSIGALPLPWLSSGIGGTRPEIAISYEHLQHRLEVTVRDSALDLLLAYMKRGRLSAAEMSIDMLSHDGTILRAIEDKRGNPLAACAAAYVSLARANQKQIDVWRNWAPNLMNWFPWMPDGAIIRGCILMDGPVSSSSKQEILISAKEAYRRGLPFFTVGIQHLREMLSLFGSDDPEAVEMLNAVRSISSRCDISEAFTTLQYPNR
jgi:hypothetical protein